MSSISFSLVRATPADSERVAAFANAYYHLEEPLSVAINVATGRVDYPVNYDNNYFLQYLPEGYSLLAVDGDDIIGIGILREVDSDNRAAIAELLRNSQTLDAKVVYRFFLQVDSEAGFRAEGDPEKALELHLLAVGTAARGRGVGRALLEAGWQVARDHGFKLFRMDCTGHYSTRLAETCDMTCIYSINYQDYKDENGEVILKPPEPHKAYKVFKKKL